MWETFRRNLREQMADLKDPHLWLTLGAITGGVMVPFLIFGGR